MPFLTDDGCLDRQRRLRKQLADLHLDAALITDYRDIYYFTGILTLPPDRFPALLLIPADGKTVMVAHTQRQTPCVDQWATYPGSTMATLNFDMPVRFEQALRSRLQGLKAQRLGYQAYQVSSLTLNAAAEALGAQQLQPIDETLATMQMRKDPDEIEIMRTTIQANMAAYEAARRMIAPGANELDVLQAATRAATLFAGEEIFHSGDYQSGQGGGPARNRAIEAGEIYIIDAWTLYRGYWSDMSRAFIVGGYPTDLQLSVFEHIAQVQWHAATLLKPGLRGTELYRQLDAKIREHPALAEVGLPHHAGHAVGLRVHMAPDLNRDREGILEPGNIVSVEPASYLPQLRAGVRLENMYLITETGSELLSEYPLELIP